jgi:catechol 2,3-dioxygenase-like lactoylglutathione lyase family enzyme
MPGHVRGIDHAMILVRDLDRARETYARMGFTLTPRGFHSLGSQNHCIMFGRDYLELMSLPASPPPAYRYYADFLAQGEGVGALALATDDAADVYAELKQAGIEADSPLALSRPVENLGEARFTLVQLPPAETPGLRTFVCQHHTRDIVWRPEYQRHANGATGIESVSIDVSDPELYPRLFDKLPVVFSRAPVPAVTALRIGVADRTRAAEVLERGGFPPARLADGSLAVRAGDAHGVALIFS